MKFRAFRKDMFRSISHSWGRFWAIFAIVALGAGFYAGLRSTGPGFRVTVDRYFDDCHFMDIRVLSAFGLTEDDVAEIKKIPGIEGIMPGYTADALFMLSGKEQTLRAHSLPKNINWDNPDYLNRPLLVEGRMPEKSGECLLGRSKEESGIRLGDSITLKGDNWKDSFSRQDFKVVGFVDSSYYLSFSLGSTSIGTGTLNRFMYIPEEDFCQEVITDLYITVDGARREFTFDEAYEKKVKVLQDALTELGKERDDIRYEEVVADSRKELEDGWAQYEEGLKEAEKGFKEAEQELKDAETTLEEKSAELKTGKLELEIGRSELEAGKLEYEAGRDEYESGYDQWLSGYTEYIAGLQEYNDGLQEMQEGKELLAEGEAQLRDAEQKLKEAKPFYEIAKSVKERIGTPTAAENNEDSEGMIPKEILEKGLTIEEIDAMLAPMSQSAKNALAGYLDETIAEYETGEAQYLAGKAELEKQKAENLPKLEEAEKQLKEAKAQLGEAKELLNSTKSQLDAGRAELAAARKLIGENEKKLLEAEKQILDGEAQLEQGREDLSAGWEEYEDQKAKTTAELEEARLKLEEGQRKLDEIDVPEWYVLDRNTNVGYASIDADSGRIDSLSTVFPVLFFLVAALVALTTMTRMVEEERVMIGTYKALGYSKGRIISKFIVYAALASVAGSILGVILGTATLPSICWNAYRMLYTAPDLTYKFHWGHALSGGIAAIACTLGATYAACHSSLAEQPASLMQPKAPKKGKRILLECIPFIWKRLKFTSKVTCRNLFRYKRRLIMTIVGISGCTALVVTGFGIKDSVTHIVGDQFDKVYAYNCTITLEEGGLSEEAEALLDDTKVYSGWMKAMKKMGDITAGDRSVSGYAFVPENIGDLKNFISLQDRVSGEEVPFGEGSVVITEKLGKMLGVSIGDSITMENSSGTRKNFTITGITENYVYHYVYIDPVLYEEVMGERPLPTEVDAVSLLANTPEQEQYTALLQADDSVATVAFSSDMRTGFEDMVSGLSIITLVLIVCAGALAFVVLYNLTNINVTERQRELATIKVLGFRSREVSAYIYRETTLLTVLGCVLGLFLGSVLSSFVIQTVEVDLVMFPRNIEPISFVYSAVITLIFSVIVDLFMNKKLRKIDMVESLKSIE